MNFEIAHPWLLLLIPACLAVLAVILRLRKSRSRKERVSAGLRIAAILLTVLALSGVSLMTASPDRAAWLILDYSASVREEEVNEQARKALKAAGDDRRTGIIVYGRKAAVDRSLADRTEWTEAHTVIDRSGSDLGEALELASALMPEEMNGGLAVISDGMVTGTEKWLKSGRSIPVNTLKTERKSGPDAQVTDLSVPATLYTGQKYTTTVTVHSNTAGEASLLLTENHGTPRARQVVLRKGENVFTFDSVAASGGVIPCEAQILLPGDTEAANDTAGAFTVVSGTISVLIAEGRSGEADELKKMLEADAMQVRVISAAMLPEEASELWAYHAVALVNVDAETLSEAQIAALDEAARELGCGVAVFGGDASYALGGYRGSSLEKMLPVTIDVRNRMELPTTALVICIDKSGSMSEASWGMNRLQLAREAACSALDVLNERDQAGVIAFDDTGKWVVPLGNVTDAEAMKTQIRTIRIGGGTAFYSPLMMAFQALKEAQAQYKHVIFLTDGEAGDTGYKEVVQQMAASGITVTTVAVGDGADYRGMQQLAEIGGGRMYTAGPFDSLPRIFTKETMMISGAYVQNRTFYPVVTDESMTDFDGFPALKGYLAVTEKPLATVSLCSDRQDPILAWWQYGAGRVACWMSDVQGGWSEHYLAWEEAAAFFGGIVSWVLPEHEQHGEIALAEGKLNFTVEAEDEILARAVKAQAEIVRPDGSRETVALEQVSARGFEGEADTSLSGAYAVHVAVLDSKGNEIMQQDGGAAVSWTREYDLRNTEEGILEALSEKTGGKTVESAEELIDFRDMAARKRQDLTPWLALAAGLLFLFDAAQRRLDWIREPEKKEKKEEEPVRKPEKKAVKHGKEEKKPEQEKAANVLWENMQNKKRL